MSTDHLHRPMDDIVAAIGERIEPEIDRLMQSAFEEAMALHQLGEQRRHDALSLVFQLSAIMAAKATMLLGDFYPSAMPDQIWNIAMTDLQMRVAQAMADLKSRRSPGSMVQ